MKTRFTSRVRKVQILIQWLTMQVQIHQERAMQIQTHQKLTIQSKAKLHIKRRLFRWKKANENAQFTSQSYYCSNNHVHTLSKLNKKFRNRFQNENENIFDHFSIFDDWTSKSTKILIFNFEFDFNYHVAFTNNISKLNSFIFFEK